MEARVLMMAFEKLSDDFEKLKGEMSRMRDELASVKARQFPESVNQVPRTVEDELLDLKQVQTILGVCYNSLKKLIDKGLIKPIRINERRVRFSKLSILNYIHS